MSATLVNTHTAHNWASTFTMPAATSPGRTLIASVTASGDNPSTITDDAGNEWVRIVGTIDIGATSQRRGQLWYCLNASAITQVQVSTSGSQNVVMVLSEWTGITGLRGYAVQNTTAGVTTTSADTGDMVIGACYYNRATSAEPLLPVAEGWASAGELQRDLFYNSTAYRTIDTAGLHGPLWDIGAGRKATVTAAFTTTSSGGESTSNAFVRVAGEWLTAEPHVRVDGVWVRSDEEPL